MAYLDREAILRILPHGPYATILDEVTDFDVTEGHEFIKTTVKLDSRYEYLFRDHFPTRPLGPAHWQIEIGCLSAAVLYFLIQGKLEKIIKLAEIEKFKFYTEVEPFDTLHITVTKAKIKRNKLLSCHILINKDDAVFSRVCEGDITGFLVPAEIIL
jgi:3-hydroxymyristoyl/3-hydroxydecanoyl-(acyl carrier protein) dehydratase